jgi:NADPH-dependent 2,4-dienoyl-CoA reductase/sulfur reductase-like enzyme
VLRLVVVGGDAAGLSAASQARRRRPPDDLEIVAFERSHFSSYSACGEPYFVGGYVKSLDDLIARTPEEHTERGIDVRTRREIRAIDLDNRRVTVFDLDGTGSSDVDFDLLMVATGAKPADGGIEGMELEGIYSLRVLEDAERLRRAVGSGQVKRAVVVGAGYIGLEMAEVLQSLDIAVTVVTSAWVMEKTLDADMGELIAERMRSMGIEVITDTRVEHMTGRNGHVAEVGCDRLELPADLVVVGLGTRPDVELAGAAGIPLGPTGAIAVDDRQRTGIDGVWAGGDCGEAKHRVSGRPVNIHLGTVANKQGRVAGINIGGGDIRFPGVLGTAITRVNDLEIARTGLTERQAADAGLDATSATAEGTTTAGYWPDAAEMSIKVVVERGSGRLLGAQIVGGPGAGKRVDVFATALWNGMAADDLAWTDLAYAPPFSGVWDLIHIAARAGAGAAAG